MSSPSPDGGHTNTGGRNDVEEGRSGKVMLVLTSLLLRMRLKEKESIHKKEMMGEDKKEREKRR